MDKSKQNLTNLVHSDVHISRAVCNEFNIVNKLWWRWLKLILRWRWLNLILLWSQLICIFLFSLSSGPKLFDVDDGSHEGPSGSPTVHFTLIFNSFVMMQIFNEINSRKVHGERQVFSGIHTNPIFVAVIIGTFVVQVSGHYTYMYVW